MDNGEGEFSFREIFTKTFVFGVFSAGEVHVVVADLEEEADEIDEGDVVAGWGCLLVRCMEVLVEKRGFIRFAAAFGLHELHS